MNFKGKSLIRKPAALKKNIEIKLTNTLIIRVRIL